MAIGRYLLLAPLGAGGMGVVYRARDPGEDRPLAIKLVRPRHGGDDARARLLRDATEIARLSHRNVVPILDVGEIGDRVFLVMPYLGGGTLGRWLRAEARTWSDVVARFVDAGHGLAAAHAAGMVHHDFKPDNVLLGDRGEVCVGDFGLASDADPADSASGAVFGTPAYMAPEQLRGERIDARADQFAFCVSLFEGLHGRRPFDPGHARGTDAVRPLLDQIVAGAVPSWRWRQDLPRWLQDLLARGLRPEPGNRWPSMDVLLEQIDRCLQHPQEATPWLVNTITMDGSQAMPPMPVPPTRAPRVTRPRPAPSPTGPPETLRTRRPHRRWSWIVAIALVVATGVLLALLLAAR